MFEYYFHMLAVVIAVGAAVFLMIGARVFITRKPIFFSCRYFFGLLFLVFLPQLIASIVLMINAKTQALLMIAVGALLIYLALIFLFWYQMRGFLATGVTDESFRAALHATLDKLNLSYQEQLSKISLTHLGGYLQVVIQPWVGAGQVKYKSAGSSEHNKVLFDIMSGVSQYYDEYGIKPRYNAPLFYIIFGGLMLSFSFTIVFLWLV